MYFSKIVGDLMVVAPVCHDAFIVDLRDRTAAISFGTSDTRSMDFDGQICVLSDFNGNTQGIQHFSLFKQKTTSHKIVNQGKCQQKLKTNSMGHQKNREANPKVQPWEDCGSPQIR